MTQDTINDLLAISKMHKEGQLTDDEFEALKNQLIQSDSLKSNTSSQEKGNTPKRYWKFNWMGRSDKFLAISIILTFIILAVTSIYGIQNDDQYEMKYVEPSKIDKTTSLGKSSTDEETSSGQSGETDKENVDYDTQMSKDPDMDESTWYEVVKEDCKICNGSGICPKCHGDFFAGNSANGINVCNYKYCMAGCCSNCGATGKVKKKVYKSIAIGSKNWRYSKKDKLRAAEKMMMNIIYTLSNGASADPNTKFGFKKYKNGFEESFGNADGIFTYSVFLCPDCKGKSCDKCYNGYVVSDSKITSDNIIYYVNAKLTPVAANNNISTSGSSSSQVTGSKRCKFCHGQGDIIIRASIPNAEPTDTWYCSVCRKNIEYAYYHHHRDCQYCGGDGQIDPGDPGYIGN